MCKFNNRLFNFAMVILAFVDVSFTSPTNRSLSKKTLEYYDDYDQNYELLYDQRQNGTENYRINLNGFLIALPSEDLSNHSDVVAAFEHINLDEDDLLDLFDNYDGEPSAIEELHGDVKDGIHHPDGHLNTPSFTQLHHFLRTNSTAAKNSERRTAAKNTAKPINNNKNHRVSNESFEELMKTMKMNKKSTVC